MKTIKSQTYEQFIQQKTHCPKCGAEQGFKNVTNPSHPSIYTCDCGYRFNPDNEKPKAPQPPMTPKMAQSSPTVMKLRQVKQLLDEVAGELQATQDESQREEITNWLADIQRTISYIQ